MIAPAYSSRKAFMPAEDYRLCILVYKYASKLVVEVTGKHVHSLS